MNDCMKSWARGDVSEQEKEEKLKIMYLTQGDKRRREIKQMICGRGEKYS